MGTEVRTYQRGSLTLAWAARSDVGHVRRINEDALVAEPGLFVVADGMGGHAAGDVASRLATEHIASLRDRLPAELDDVVDTVAVANSEIRREALATGSLGMGTTLVAAVLVQRGEEESIVVVNVGDSRCYLADDEGMRIVTHDHSVVQELLDAGMITADEARSHPERHVVTRALGSTDRVRPDFIVLERRAHQRMLLCSDGVSGQLAHEQLVEAMRLDRDAGAAVDLILDEVLAGAAPDNATAVVVDIHWTSEREDVEITAPRPAMDVTGPRPAPTARAVPTGMVIHAVPGVEPPAPPAEEQPVTPISEVPR
jgi:serine/threonine protein phosphatase PrpC